MRVGWSRIGGRTARRISRENFAGGPGLDRGMTTNHGRLLMRRLQPWADGVESSRAVKVSQGQFQGQAMIRRASWPTPLFPQLCSISVSTSREWWKQPMWRPAPLPTASHPTPTLRLPYAYPMPSLGHHGHSCKCCKPDRHRPVRAEHVPPRPQPTLDIRSPKEPLGRGRI